ncbi:Transposon Ty3-G Gag-Pol polyprotein [Labeo rohita]|uniref:ribonuclease H n=1 Tax=Labeo rohita TaxID=84645 RepID=A0ABQ8M6S1_LABRO|nr:Transposon Ty3-G Gag-Pol polyprotein [Labeo rohita]
MFPFRNSSRVETLWERLQRDRALNHVCNQTNGRTKRHRRVTSLTRKHKSTKPKTLASQVLERVFLPALVTSRAGIHTLYAWLAWERSMRHQPSSGPIARIATHCRCVCSAPGRTTSPRRGPSSAFPRGSGPASAKAERRLHSWGSQLDLVEGMETGDPLSSASPTRSAARPSGSEARAAVSSPRGSASTLAISSSEEVDVVSVDEAAAPQFPQYEELLEVVTRAVAKLSIDWPAEPLVEPQKSKLDERFLRSRPPPARRSLPFFPDLHTEVSRSWNAPFSSRLFIPASYNYGYVAGLDERGYRAMPRVEQTLASYLSPESASSLKAPVLPSKPLRVTSALVGKGYTAAGQAGACLHTMSVLQAYQADLLKELDEGEEIKDSDISELRRTADLSLRATKETARAIGRSMAALVAAGDTRRRVSKRQRSSGSSLAVIRLAGLLRRSSPSRLPAPRTGKLRNRAWPLALLPIESEWSNALVEEVLDQAVLTGRDRRGQPHLGGKRVAPQYSVSGSPPCPREIALPTLPVFQGAAVSSEHPPQFFPPGNVAGLGSSPPPRGVLPAGQPFQDTVPAAPLTPEASLERLVPLVDHLAAWKLLPNVSAWVLHTVERGYRIQFGAPPPPFNWVSPTLVGPEQGLVMEQEVATLLRKEAIEVVPPHERESGFYSRYFIVPKKDGGLRPILDLRLLNRSVKRLKFKMLTIKQVVSQIRSEDWFVTIDLKDAYFHVSILPHHRKFLRFAFRGEAYQYRGIRILNYIDDWLILAQSEMSVGFDHDAGTSVSCSDRVDPHCSQESEGRPVTHCQAVPATAGSDGSSVQRDTFWPAVHETPTVVAQDQGVFPEGKPTSHDQGHAALPTCPGHVEEALVLVSGPGVGSSLSPRNASDGRVPHRLGSGHEWPPCPRSVERSPTHVAHKLPGDAGRVSGSETLSPGPKRPPCVGPHRQHLGGLLHQPPGRSAFAPLVQAGAPDPCVVPGQTPLAESSLCSWASQLGSRHPVETGAEARGMDASPRGGEADLESVWSSPGGPVCHEGEHAMSPLVLSSSSSSPGAGCHGADVAEATSVRLSPDRSAPGSSRESAPGRGVPSSSSPVLAGPSMVLGPDFSPRRLSLGDSRQGRSPLTGRGHHSSPPAGAVEALGVASEGAHLLASGLSTEVVETILQSRAPSTRKLYALKWKLFTSWCGHRQQDPVNCPVGSVLEFLQSRLSAGLSHSTLKVYVAAIAAYHAPLGGLSVGKDPLVTRFLHGALRLRPPVRPRVPSWDLSVVLEALCRPPFEPVEEISDRFLTLKTVLLLALSSLKRIGDLQALSVAPSFLDFAPGLSKAFLFPKAGYVPKVPTSTPRPVVLQAFCPPPFGMLTSRSLIVCVQCERWMHTSTGLPGGERVRAHSTRSMAASKAFLAGVPMQDICNAAGWSSPLTFVRFYELDLRVSPGNETPRLVAILLRPCALLLSGKLTLVLAHVLLCFLVSDVTRL